MQVAAMNPMGLSDKDISQDILRSRVRYSKRNSKKRREARANDRKKF